MIHTKALIVGGGPAGAACAWRLNQRHVECLIVDKAVFPRFKPCAGWITPQVMSDLEFTRKDYPFGMTEFRSFDIEIKGIPFKLPTRQYAIRRYEFDRWLLERSGAGFVQHEVKEIQTAGGGFEIDGEFSGDFLVGAGGTRCPVFRALFEPTEPRSKDALIVAMEEEFQFDAPDQRCRLWFFDHGLPGYVWHIPKEGGILNVGIGGKAETLKTRGDTLKNHWNRLVKKLEDEGLIHDHHFQPAGHSYYLRQSLPEIRKGNAFITGDALGLATFDMGEGIAHAIRSGILAADAISLGMDYSVQSIPRYSFPSLLGLRRESKPEKKR